MTKESKPNEYSMKELNKTIFPELNETIKGLDKDKLEELRKEIIKLIPQVPIEKEGEVLCKMAINGKASKLYNIIGNILGAYYQSSGSYQKAFDTNLKITLMIEKCDDDIVIVKNT